MTSSLFPSGVPVRKRLFDLTLTVVGLLLLSPILGFLGLRVWQAHGRPVLFRQQRPGFRARPFTLLKFRTMTDARDERGRPLADAERLTRLGSFLRSYSLDDLPNLFNVLRGEMSLVGPRPLLMQYLDRYTPEQARRHNVLPGITGWAQIHGRNALAWDERFRMDVWYVDHWTLALDARILLATLSKVLRREGISQPGQATSEEFRGNRR
jgi:sugar transferase EpsL